MNIRSYLTNSLLFLYRNINRIGLLDSHLMRSFYIKSYFIYKKYYEDPYARLVKYHPALFKRGHIIDIGANIGYTSHIFSKAIQTPFKIFAFEPEKRNIDLLKMVSQKYSFANKLVVVAAAVGNKAGEIELWMNESNSADHRVLTESLRKEITGKIKTQKVSLVTIDDYLKATKIQEQPISFIKIDVQGFELSVCEGMDTTLANNPNAIVSIEYCPSVINSLGFDPENLLQFFKNRKYDFYIINKKNIIEPFNFKKTPYL